ncbi:hypothetical protein [Paenibacillus sp. FSL L8-0709]|uniref:hypothetical protein n=1 Tax=Paenibacillus sp. FSL L8-0709 TaxID=2975312 RepID=UPI0030F7064A
MSFSNNTIENRGMMEDLATYFDKSVPIQMIERQMDILLDLIEELNSYRKRIKLGIERARVQNTIRLYIKRYVHLEEVFDERKSKNESLIESM